MPNEDHPDEALEQPELEKQFEQCCNDYGKAINEGRHDDAEAIAMQMMQLAMLRAMNEEPSQEMIWKQMAGECEEQGNWAGAEEALRNALTLEREGKVRELPVKTHLDLASLYEMLGRDTEALAQINAAVELSHDSEIMAIRTMALEAKAKMLLVANDPAGAKEVALDALGPIPDDKLHELMKARMLVLLGRCDAVLGNLEPAEEAVSRAMELVRPYGENKFLGGLQGFMAQSAATTAAILSGRGKLKEAAESFAESIERARTIAEQPHLCGPRSNYRLAQALSKYATYLDAAKRGAEAAAARAESEALLRALRLPVS
jgi:tetratricopeptide (TPR) repeat protein